MRGAFFNAGRSHDVVIYSLLGRIAAVACAGLNVCWGGEARGAGHLRRPVT